MSFGVARSIFFTVGCTIQALAQGVSMFPQQINFAAPAGSSARQTATVTVTSGTPNIEFDAAARYLTPVTGWLSVTPTSGTTPATLTVSADPSNLAAGTYQGQITVAAGPQRVGAVVDVFLTVGAGVGGDVTANPSSLTFIGPFRSPSVFQSTQILSLGNPAGVAGSVAYTAVPTSSGNWLSVTPLSGTLPATLNVTATAAGLASGTYTGTIKITAGGAMPTVVPVTFVWGNASTPDALTLSQPTLSIRHQVGTAAPFAQNISVSTTSGLSRFFTATTSTPWITLLRLADGASSTTLTDTTPNECGILIQPAGLAPGTYTGSVTFTVAGLPPQDLPVVLSVSTSPTLNAYPGLILLDSDLRTSTTVVVESSGSANLPFSATVVSPFASISVSPPLASTPGGYQSLTVTANAAALPVGTYLATVVLTVLTSGETLNVPVRLTVRGGDAAGPKIVATASVSLEAVVGEAPVSRTIEVLSVPGLGSPSQPFTAAAASTRGWLGVSPFSGTAPGLITLVASTTATPPGVYRGTVTITNLTARASDTIDVTLTLAARAIAAEPASLRFQQIQKGVPPPPAALRITGNAPSSFTVAARPPWVSVSPLSGSTPAVLTVSADPTGLGPGTYKGNVQLNGPNRIDVEVSLAIPEPSAPTASPASLSFAYEIGRPAPAEQSLDVGSTGPPIKFTATAATGIDSGIGWLKVTPASGATPAKLAVSVDPAGLVPGTHSGMITIAAADGSAVPAKIPITLTVSSPATVVREVLNAATLAPTALSPGVIISITGAGLGPIVGAEARPTAAGAYATQLAGVRVLFDGSPAPLLFVRDDQINAIAPYALSGRASSRLRTEFGSSVSLPIDCKVVDAAPGIFTVAGAGRGQAAALNADFTANSITNPAARGSVITVFGTGEGQTDPPGQDGRINQTDLRRPLLPVTAKIAGRSADVVYAGSAPGLVSGTLQVNIRVPEDIEPGSVPLEIQVGAAASQSRVTVEIR